MITDVFVNKFSIVDNKMHSLYSYSMDRKLYIITVIVIVILLLILIIPIIGSKQQQPSQKQISNSTPTPPFTADDTSYSPYSKNEITGGEIIRESTQINNSTLQKFIIKNPADGNERQLFSTNQANLTFEKITANNWSPTNRFLFVYADSNGKRDLLFMKTDGKFTNGQYFLHSTGLYPNLTIINAQWVDNAALKLQTMNVNTHVIGNYIVDFDDDTGVMMPATIYNTEYAGD